MEEIVKDVTGIAMAIIGVAILYTLVSPRNDTSKVISSATSGFSTALATAMGTGASSSTIFTI